MTHAKKYHSKLNNFYPRYLTAATTRIYDSYSELIEAMKHCIILLNL